MVSNLGSPICGTSRRIVSLSVVPDLSHIFNSHSFILAVLGQISPWSFNLSTMENEVLLRTSGVKTVV